MTMKKIANSFTLRAGIASALCLSFIIYSPLRVSSAKAATRTSADLKTESQLRAEASRYDGAIRAIAEVATMKLDTPEDLKKAFAVLDRERPNLKFHRSKLIVLGLSDSTFSSAIKKKAPNKQAAEAFAKELKADRKAILKLNGAESLTSRIRRSAESDSATLRRAGERLKEAAETIKKAGQRSAAPGAVPLDGLMLLQAGFSEVTQPTASLETLMMTPQGGPAETIMIIAVTVALVFMVASYGYLAAEYMGVGEKEDQDEVAACQQTVDGRYSTCVSEARDLPSGFPLYLRELAEAGCYADWLFKQGECLTLYI
jgi:hypothetical protein